MFMKTMAVGPLDDVPSCVTGGTTVAKPARWPRKLQVTGRAPERALFNARGRGRKAMVVGLCHLAFLELSQLQRDQGICSN